MLVDPFNASLGRPFYFRKNVLLLTHQEQKYYSPFYFDFTNKTTMPVAGWVATADNDEPDD